MPVESAGQLQIANKMNVYEILEDLGLVLGLAYEASGAVNENIETFDVLRQGLDHLIAAHVQLLEVDAGVEGALRWRDVGGDDLGTVTEKAGSEGAANAARASHYATNALLASRVFKIFAGVVSATSNRGLSVSSSPTIRRTNLIRRSWAIRS